MSVEGETMILVTPSEMNAIDAETIKSRGLPSLVLMENAARSVLPHVPPGSVIVLVGPGNNGGDGLVLARALKESGRQVEAIMLSETLSEDAAIQRDLAEAWGVTLTPHWSDSETDLSFPAGSVVVDALFGTGLSRDLSGRFARALEGANKANVFRLAIDIPSGIDGATGRILGTSLRADKTVTFGVAKWGHVLFPGKERCGQLILTQPGFHPEALEKYDRVRFVTHSLAQTLLPTLWPTMHKGDNGRLLMVTGSDAYPGAGILGTLGALRGGGGLVSYASTDELRPAIMSWAPEALLIDRSALEEINGFNAMVIGSGLGSDTDTYGPDLLDRFGGPVVIDADALKFVSRYGREKRSSWILTPHPGEMGKLLQKSVADLEKDRIGNALEAASHLGCTICFKGSPTVCASPDGRAFVNSTGNAVLAQGGTGDVLAGLIGAYVGYGLPALEATAAAVYIHGLSADLHARDGCPRGVGAHAVAQRIPEAFGIAVGKERLAGVL